MRDDGLLEARIADWRTYLRRRRAIHEVDVEEVEDHLRNEMATLEAAGLADDEAFLVAVKRMGDLDSLSREFAREYSERIWKQLVVAPGPPESTSEANREAWVAVALAVAAALAIKLPELFGLSIPDSIYLLNLSLFVLPFLAGYLGWKRGLDRREWAWLAVPFIVAGLVVNLLPFEPDGHTMTLTALHLPIALWLAVGFAYTGGQWRDHDQRMNFVRFSGEWLIYYTLIALGGGVLMAFTMFIFKAIAVETEGFLESWLLPCGVVGAVVVSAWLVEAKQSVVENMAPVLTRLFTPLFTLLLLAFLVIMIWTGSGIEVEREVLIVFDLLLVLVLGLVLYSISARDPQAPPGAFDALQLVLVLSALLVDAMALWAIASRISAFGFSPNKVAALGENLILLVNLGWTAVLYLRFLKKGTAFASIERWQTAYLPVYAIWAWVVVALFPVLFDFRWRPPSVSSVTR